MPFVIPVQLTPQRPNWGWGWGSNLEDEGPGQMMLPGGPPSPNKDQRPGNGEEGSPFFLSQDPKAFSSYLWSGRASTSLTSSPPLPPSEL